jgi:hypothetical protein
VAVTLAFGSICVVGGWWWWRGNPPVLQCADQTDGSRVCYTFVRPPTAVALNCNAGVSQKELPYSIDTNKRLLEYPDIHTAG